MSSAIQQLRLFWHYWIKPIFPLDLMVASPQLYWHYISSWRSYQRLPAAESLDFNNSYPCLFDASPSTPFDPHYFYQAIWAMQHIANFDTSIHIDIGSDIRFVGMLTTHLPVIFVDIRPLKAQVVQLSSLSANITKLPFRDASVSSLSCLHVAEHIGLGRYGDTLNPSGTRQACTELARVLAPGGNLLFSLPVGKPRVSFNAHRIHNPNQILDFFSDLTLVEFSAVDDSGQLHINTALAELTTATYSCGLFWFRRSGQ